ncbi:MAG TPA: alpha/beta fold hydrolase [Candidatus Mediterraneibacter norfolkensis]|nr:alpha/beta fold hydrolase [Candidatus Mediterraneibacter norfolkensis]
MKTRKKQIVMLLISLIILIGSAWGANGIETGFETIEIERVYFENDMGDQLSGILYRPRTATAENPAPAIVTAHGNNSYPDALASYNIELSRRGYVVLAFEMEGHGQSDYVPDEQGDGSYGGTDAAEYLLGLDYVDSDQIGATGHSKGSNVAVGMAREYPESVKSILLNGYISPSITSAEFDREVPHTNIGLNMSRYDECGQDLLHHTMGTDWNYDYLRDEDAAAELFSESWGGGEILQYVNEGLGNWDDGTKRIFYTIEDCTHVTTVNSKTAITNGLEFFMNSIDAPIPIASSNQVWGLRFVFGTIEIVGIVMLLLSLGSFLFSLNYFKSLSGAENENAARLDGKRGLGYRLFFIAVFTIIPVLTFVPCYVFGENEVKQTVLFPFNPSSSGYLIWTVANAAGMFLVFLIWHFVYGRKHGGNMKVYGILPGADRKEALVYIGKSALYGICMIVPVFIVLLLVEKLLHVEATTWIFNIRTFRLDRIVYFVQYFIPFFISFLISNIAFSAILRDDEPGKSGRGMVLKNQLIGVLQGAGGLTVMYIIWNMVYFVSGKPSFLYRETPYVMGNAGFMCICFSLIPMFGINAILSTQMSVKTKKIWVGAFVCALFIVWITFAGQSLALPSTQSAVGALAG